MHSGIEPLTKILKDPTRRKILLLLNEKGSLTYTDLMDDMGFLTTGLLNYHLKVLGDLLAKDEIGHYALTEKGKIASKLLLEFPENKPIESQGKPKWWRTFWIGVGVVTLAFVGLNLLMYFLGYIGFSELYQNMLWGFSAIGIAYMIQHILRDVLSKKTKLVIAKIVYILGGLMLGLVIAYFGVGVTLSAISSVYDKAFAPHNLLYDFFWSVWYQGFATLIAPILGAIAMYHYGKRRRFQTPNYNPDF